MDLHNHDTTSGVFLLCLPISNDMVVAKEGVGGVAGVVSTTPLPTLVCSFCITSLVAVHCGGHYPSDSLHGNW